MTDDGERRGPSRFRPFSRRRLLALAGAGIAGSLAGCGNSASSTDTPSEAATPTATPTADATPTAAVEPAPTETDAPTGTPTETPTSTGTPTETPTSTETPTPTGTPTETPVPVSEFGSSVHYDDGFADTDWFDDDVTVFRITELTRAELEGAFASAVPSLVVFETSGVVDLEGRALTVRGDKTWVAGQTAPSPGVTFVNGLVSVEADDCVVQHLRVFRGEGESSAEGSDPLNSGDDTENVVFDHCSAYWGRDENLSVGYRTTDTTLANCLVAEGLEEPEENSNGSLIGNEAANVAIMGTVYAKNNDRNPRHKDNTDAVLANNLVYYFDKASWLSPGARASIVGNAYVGRFDWSDAIVKGDGSAYVDDNLVADPGLGDRAFSTVAEELSSPPLWPEGFEAMPSEDVEAHNRAYAGARPADRIWHEKRVIAEIRDRSLDTAVANPGDSEIPNHHDDVGGYPRYDGTTRSLSVPDSGLRAWLERHAVAVEEPDVGPP